MPVIKQIGKNKYQYQCECGREVTLETDESPLKRAVKCWECLEREGLIKNLVEV